MQIDEIAAPTSTSPEPSSPDGQDDTPTAEKLGVMERRDGLLQAELLEASFTLITPRAEALVDRFYFRLFRAAPETYHLFDPSRFGEQKHKLLAALKLTVNSARKPETLEPVLRQLGAKHVGYGVRDEHYPVVGSILLATLAEFAGDAWTDDLRDAWLEAYTLVAGLMMDGAAAA
jgi:hemoglobin-like flavoprotein